VTLTPIRPFYFTQFRPMARLGAAADPGSEEKREGKEKEERSEDDCSPTVLRLFSLSMAGEPQSIHALGRKKGEGKGGRLPAFI